MEPSGPPSVAAFNTWRQVCVVGVGLIGGSVVRALKARVPALRVVGVDRSEAPSGHAAAVPLDAYCPLRQSSELESLLHGSDAVILAAPVDAILDWLPHALSATRKSAVVLDCGSTKRRIAEVAQAHPEGERCVPGHPMAGSLASGTQTNADLFESRPWVLCAEHCTPLARSAAEAFVQRIGAKPVFMDSAQHDRAVALTSHAARLVASTLSVLAERAGALPASGPAFERLLRAAGGDPLMWRSVLVSNAVEVAAALEAVAEELSACAAELRQGSPERGLAVMTEAERVRAHFQAEHLGPRTLL
jgi:prephenate dehydrogenase